MRWGLFLVVLVVALAACGGGAEEAQPTPSPSPAVAQPSPTPTATPTPELTATPTPEPAVQRIAYRGADGSLWIMNADGSGQERLTDIPAIGEPRWSPDGTRIGFISGSTGDYGIYVMNADGSNLTLLAEDIPACGPHWSADGTRIAIPCDGIYVINADGSGLTRLDIAASYVDWSPDGRWLAFFAVIGELGHSAEVSGMLADLQTTEVEPIDPDEQPSNESVSISPIFSPTDASLLAYGSRLFDLNTGQERSLPGRAVSWSPDGHHLLLGLETCEGAQVYDVQKGNSVLEFDISLRAIGASCWDVMRGQSAWSPDSRFLATYDVPTGTDALGVLHLRDIDTGDQKTVSMDFPYSLKFSPDSRLLLFYGADGIWVLGSDGTNLILLAEGSRAAWQPQP